MLDGKGESLKTMAGSFGYAAPEVMRKEGHGKPVDMWSMGVITYTLLCGYSPFRSENLQDLIRECTDNSVVFHERYWKDVSNDAKDFILKLINPDPDQRWTSEVSYSHHHNIVHWLTWYRRKHWATSGLLVRTPPTTTCCPRSSRSVPEADSGALSRRSSSRLVSKSSRVWKKTPRIRICRLSSPRSPGRSSRTTKRRGRFFVLPRKSKKMPSVAVSRLKSEICSHCNLQEYCSMLCAYEHMALLKC